LPTTAPATITLTGSVRSPTITGSDPVIGAQVEVVGASGTIASATTASDGTFTVPVSTGSHPVDGHLKVTASGHLDAYWYPAVPMAGDVSVGELESFTSTILGLLGLSVGISLDNTKGQVFVHVVDCNGVAISGATVGATPAPGSLFYIAAQRPSASATATDSDGEALLINQTAGSVTLTANSGSTALRSHAFTSTAGAVIQANIQP
jgi:hypothetical protein